MRSFVDGFNRMCQLYDDHLQCEAVKYELTLMETKKKEIEMKTNREKIENELAKKRKIIETQYVDAFIGSKHKINFDVIPVAIKFGVEIATFGTGLASGSIESPDKEAVSELINNYKNSDDIVMVKDFCSNYSTFQRCELIRTELDRHKQSSSDSVRVYCDYYDPEFYDPFTTLIATG